MKKLKIKKPKWLIKDKEPRAKKKIWQFVLIIILILAIVAVSLFLAFSLYIVITSPDFEDTALYQTEPTILYDINGDELTRVGEDLTIVTYDELPEVLIDAIVATEDSRFFQHNGIDIVRFLKASFLQLLGQSKAGGASTLSMQVIKNTYTQKGNTDESTIESFIRKFQDIYMSVFKLEKNYTKAEIIEFYVNSQWFANDSNLNTTGITGVERGSQYLFGKSVSDLNLAEASLMAGMFQNTAVYNPYKNEEGCRNRQTSVLNYMVMHGYITEEQRNEVLDIPISTMLVDHSNDSYSNEPYQEFVDFVINEVSEDLNLNAYHVALEIYTTYDPDIQSVLEDVENGDAYSFPDDEMQEGIAVTSVETGAILALSGGRNYQARGLDRATDISRQPGSSIKPVMDYSMYIENISQSTYAMFLDEKTTYSNGTSISNYDNSYTGLITMRYAIKDSRNIPALLAFKAVAAIDINIIKNFVHSMGIDYGDDLYESASIGGFNGVSPLEMSAAYATFGRGGYYIEPYGYTKVIDKSADDKEYIHSYTKEQVMEDSTAYMITNLLISSYGGKGAGQIAGKTGTTNLDKSTKTAYGLPSGALLDAWIISYNPSYSIALWLGYDELTSESAENHYYLTSGIGSPARRAIMNYLATHIYSSEKFTIPSSVTTAKVEQETFPAQLCSEYTPSSMCLTEYFVKGTEPTDISERYSQLSNPTNGTATYDGTKITISWTAIATPSAIDTTYLAEHYNTYYGEYAEKYYNKRISYNESNIGTLGYQIYLKDTNGNLKSLGYTSNTSYTYNGTSDSTYTFIVKSAYSIFKSNMSSGLTITAQISINASDNENEDPELPEDTPIEEDTGLN